jgi:hypothetical protein
MRARDWNQRQNKHDQDCSRGQSIRQQCDGDIPSRQPLAHDAGATTAARRNAVPINSATARNIDRISLASDLVEFFLQRKTIQSGKGQTQEQTDSSIEEQECVTESSFHLLLHAAHCSGIGHTPVRGQRLARPYRADFVGRVITDRKNKIEPRGIWPREFIPGFSTEAGGRQMRRL